MSERDGPDPELERRLDAAFRGTRPRRGFEDELWARLQAQRPWWRRIGDGLGGVRWGGVATGLTAVLVVGLLVVTVVRLGGARGGGAGMSSAAVPATRAAPGGAADSAGLPFGRLPAPRAASVSGLVAGGQPAAAGQPAASQGAVPAPQPATLPVFRYGPPSGPADGTILEVGSLPGGLESAAYPTRSVSDALAGASRSGAVAGHPSAVLTQARLVYVAVVSGGQGFLEPAYLCTGTAPGAGGSVPVQVLVPALAPAALG